MFFYASNKFRWTNCIHKYGITLIKNSGKKMYFKRAQLILAHGSNADEMLILIKERSQAVKINFYNKNLMFVVVTIQRQ